MTTPRHAARCTLIALLLCFTCPSFAETTLDWESLPPLPTPLTGHFAGVHNGVILVAGGASHNPIEDATAAPQFYSDIFVLEPGAESWRAVGALPEARAHGAGVSTAEGVWIIGGTDGARHYDDIIRLEWNDGALNVRLPSPIQETTPAPLAYMGATVQDDVVYLFGGSESPGAPTPTNHFWSMDLSQPAANWLQLDPGPVSPRLLPAMSAHDGQLYLFGGTNDDDSPLAEVFRYSADAGWTPIAAMPSPPRDPAALPYGLGHLLVFGGDAVLAYHPLTESWAAFEPAPANLQGARVVAWQDRIAVVGGQQSGGEASAEARIGDFAPRGNAFGLLDYAALIVYFALIVWMGFYFARREKSTEVFFLGGRKIPWWAVGISIFGTSLSAITYISIPATAYATNWVLIVTNMSVLLIAPFVVVFYMPRLREHPVTTAYEYLEKRFNLATRIYGSVVFATFQLGRMAIVLYLPAMVLAAATGINIYFCIVAMGVLATLYTVLGGIEAVIWTDVIQAVVLVFGALLAFVIIIANIDGGFPEMIRTAADAEKFHTFNWTWDPTVSAVWVALIGGAFLNAYPAMADQTVVQRYLSTSSAREASKAVWTNALLTIPIQLLFFGLGTALWVFFKRHPSELDPSLVNDAILPLFVVQQFPAGLRGVLIAGLFAASMSSLDSSMNSMSSVFVNDYYRRFKKAATDHSALVLARALTIVFGAFGTLSAIYVATTNQSTVFELFIRFLGLVGGGLAGIFVLGVFTKKANGVGALFGAVTSGVVMYYVRNAQINSLLHGMIGFLTAFIVGYLVSVLLESEQEI